MMPHNEMTWSSGLIPMIEPEIITQIISSIADLAFILSASGQILSVMTSPRFTTVDDFKKWEGDAFCDHLSIESVAKFEPRFETYVQTNKPVLPVELNHHDAQTETGFPMRYTFHQIGTDGSILMLGQDLRPVWDIQQQLVAAQIALERDYEAQRHNDTLFRVLMASTEEAAVFVALSSGEVSDCNPAATAMFGKQRNDLKGSSFASAFDAKDGRDLIDRLTSVSTDQSTQSMTVSTRAPKRDVVIHPTIFRVACEQMLLCRVSLADGNHVQADALNSNLVGLFENGIDGIVFAAKDGRILSANEAFLNQSDVTNSQGLKGRVVSDFLGRGTVDMNVVFENASRNGAMRVYLTKLISEHGAERPVEISTSSLQAGNDAAFVLVIRDANRVDSSKDIRPQATDVDMVSLIELIGSQSLKDIVAQTTDVVEKMCIETAVEMTSNNRVAAAEMLGLSRQSLYVKLRKYGLLKKDA